MTLYQTRAEDMEWMDFSVTLFKGSSEGDD